MANSTTTTSFPILLSSLLFLLLLLLPSTINATRPAPVLTDNSKKQKECFDELGGGGTNTGLGGANTGLGGITAGTGNAIPSGGIPSFTDLDHSGPAAANARYIPGFDDTFVPNPGYEIPRSSGGGSVP